MATKRKRTGERGNGGLLHADTMQIIVASIRVGMTWKDAAARAGVSARVVHLWRERGDNALDALYDTIETDGTTTPDDLTWDAIKGLIAPAERKYAQLVYELTRANLDAKFVALGQIHRQMNDDWRASAWFLERRFPDEFGPQAIRLTADVTSRNVNVEVDPDDTETLAQIIAAMESVRIGGTTTEGN